MSIYKNALSRTVMTVFMILAMTLTASATDFITDVMLLGNKDQTTFNSQLSDLTDQGWLDINYDLNSGCGSGTDYIHLLYKKQSSSGNTGTPITDFYIRTGDNPPSSLTYGGRTYHLVSCNGSDRFINNHGDLNSGCGSNSAYIYLYYTKDVLSNNHGVTGITFNATQSDAVGENGGSTGYDLNTGCGSNSAYIYMHLATTTGANVVTLSSSSGEVILRNGHILTGTGGSDTNVAIADGATVTFSGVNITSIANNDSHQWPGISCLGDATITIGESTTNNVKGGYRSSGIFVPQGKTLTLQGSGTLNANGGEYAAGIGSGYDSSCGNITISGGTVTATGGNYGAGIGSGSNYSSCGDITINGGTVNTTGGDGAAGIGSGFPSTCGSITISGGTVTATGGWGCPGIGSGYNLSDCGHISITQGVTSVTAIKSSNCNNAIGAGKYSTCGTVTMGYYEIETGFITQSPFTTFPYYVALNANGGTGYWANPEPFMYNVEQPLLENVLTCTGYTWDGWATTPDGPKVYDDMQVVSNLAGTSGATVTLYARWIAPKAIAGYGTGSGGWKLIASPFTQAVTPTANNGFLTGAYDLYRFDQAATDGLEWRNYKATPFDLESGRGYLYASQAGSTLTFNGTPYSGNGQVTLTKTDGFEFSGWNLIGNPFGTAKTIGSKPFYRMNNLGTDIIAATNSTIAAMEGIFVVADTDGETVTFAESTRGGESEKRIIINLSDNAALIDRAIIRFDEGQTLPKFQLFENSTKIYIPQNGKDYAVATAEPEGELPINFKAKENGTYTLTISVTANCQLLTANLIDNLTGANTDLLATPSYTFEAKVTDYESRFKLVFNADGNDNKIENENFAFISNGELTINGTGTLQIFDILGHELFRKELPTANCQLPTAPGIYVLRLINGDTVKTQKIVVR